MEEAQEKGEGHAYGGSNADPQPSYSHVPAKTGCDLDMLREIGQKISRIPEHVDVNKKLAERFLASRREAIENDGPINWAFAEALAFGSLIKNQKSVRLSGQDCRRGTFSQRHAVLYDPETRKRYTPLNHMEKGQLNKLWVYNSHLSEFAVLGFEYGYSLVATDTLVLWEAQFGDFANGAQVIIDQFISSAESKWQRSCSLVMLLPHGYEGQGPEHSSARLERFMQVCHLTTPAQYFHVLRRQMMRDFRKPLIMMTPKSLLNLPECTSRLEDFGPDVVFQEVIDDDTEGRGADDRISRIIFSTGKVYYDLLKHRDANEINNVALIRIEQLYPFHRERIEEVAGRYPNASKWVWCQEEPLNMGAWSFIGPRLQKLTDHHVRYAGRDTAASPAGGSKTIHKMEQQRLIEKAFHV